MNSLIVHILLVERDLQVYINGSITPMIVPSLTRRRQSRVSPRMMSLKYAFDIELCRRLRVRNKSLDSRIHA